MSLLSSVLSMKPGNVLTEEGTTQNFEGEKMSYNFEKGQGIHTNIFQNDLTSSPEMVVLESPGSWFAGRQCDQRGWVGQVVNNAGCYCYYWLPGGVIGSEFLVLLCHCLSSRSEGTVGSVTDEGADESTATLK